MQLREIMTRDVHAIQPDTTLRDAAETMKLLDVGALPVCRNDKLVGVITDRDITVRAVADGEDPILAHVDVAMTPDLVYCYEDEDVERAAKLMEEHQIRRLPVLDRSKCLVGIVSLGDLATRRADENLSGNVLEQVSQPTQPHA